MQIQNNHFSAHEIICIEIKSLMQQQILQLFGILYGNVCGNIWFYLKADWTWSHCPQITTLRYK